MPASTEQVPVHLVTCRPRILRANAAPSYLGSCRNVFNKTVRPYVPEFRIAIQGIGFDRPELGAWADAPIDRAILKKEGAWRDDYSRRERQGETSWQSGETIERTPAKDLADQVKSARGLTIGRHDLNQGEPSAACYFDTSNGRVFSLRRSVQGLGLSEVVKASGGDPRKHRSKGERR